MKRTAGLYILISILSLLILPQCSTRDKDQGTDVEISGNEEAADGLDNLEKERRKLSQDLRELRDEINEEIEEIDKTMEKTGNDSKITLRRRQEELTGHRTKIEKTIDDVENSSEETWAEIKRGAKNTFNDVRNEFQQISDETGG